MILYTFFKAKTFQSYCNLPYVEKAYSGQVAL